MVVRLDHLDKHDKVGQEHKHIDERENPQKRDPDVGEGDDGLEQPPPAEDS